MKRAWQKLPKPFFCLAPMEGVTDSVFRRVIVRVGKPDLMFTEFTSADGLLSKGFDYVSERLEYESEEQPLIAQIWGREPENLFKTAQVIKKLGFGGIDINLGCAVRAVMSKECGAALIGKNELVTQMIQATVRGGDGLPVSVKTRLGIKAIETEKWLGYLLSQPLAAITVHLRTATELSKVPAHWEEMTKIVALRDKSNPEIKIIGNGDVLDLKNAGEKVKQYGADGVMIGRGVFRNPWVFAKDSQVKRTKRQKLDLLLYHLDLFTQTYKDEKRLVEMRKYFKIYVKGFPGAMKLLRELMKAETGEEIYRIIKTEMIQSRA